MEATEITAIEDTDVLIVGAGPTGLALAIMLVRSGIKMQIVDKLLTGQNTSRAAVIHAHTLEVLESLGVSERLVKQGLTLTKFSIRDRDRILLRLRFDTLPTRYNYLLMLPQDKTEKVLIDILSEAGGGVHWGNAVEKLVETCDGIRACIETKQGKRIVNARFVIGADGMNSLVRESVGIEFSGGSYEQSFVLADVQMNGNFGNDEVMQFFSPAGLLVVAPLPGNRHRIVAMLDNAPAQPGIADVQALLDTRGPMHSVGKVTQMHWSSRFRLHHRVAERYRRRHFILVGDAAHVHSPAGGQGMNTGLVDACVLGRILSHAILQRGGDCQLDKYEMLRRPAALQVLKLAERLTKMAVMSGSSKQLVRNVALQAGNLIPLFRNRLAMNLSGLSRRTSAEIEF
ncbi:MAG: FAD-dependent monooxygenase [Nitrosomonas sp. PRO4]|nr:FAD-dependent monooxygenase [Nitrosomonas sp. PRO4]